MATIHVLPTAEVSEYLLTDIHGLMLRAFAGDFSAEDWAHTLGGRHVVVTERGAVVAHAAVVPRILEVAGRPVRTGYVEGVATAPEREREGLGSRAMTEASEILRRNFEMGALATSRPDFYARLGWEQWRGPTFVRQGDKTIRTEDEDGGVMVLRFGPSRDVDLDSSISCEARPGDDW